MLRADRGHALLLSGSHSDCMNVLHCSTMCSESPWFVHVAHLCFVSLWFIHSCHDVLLHGDRRRKRVVTRSAVQPSAVHGLGLSDLFSYPSTVAALKYMSSTEDEILKARRPPSKCGTIFAQDSVFLWLYTFEGPSTCSDNRATCTESGL